MNHFIFIRRERTTRYWEIWDYSSHFAWWHSNTSWMGEKEQSSACFKSRSKYDRKRSHWSLFKVCLYFHFLTLLSTKNTILLRFCRHQTWSWEKNFGLKLRALFHYFIIVHCCISFAIIIIIIIYFTIFSRYGDLSATDGILVIKKPSSNPQIQNQIVCYGVIHFDQRESAETAKNDLNNTYFGGRRLRVEWNRASRKSLAARFPTEENYCSESLLHYSSMSPVISIYIQFETLDSDSRVNEALITEIFEPFGHMTGCFIKTNNTSVSGLRQHGYAFVHFDNR